MLLFWGIREPSRTDDEWASVACGAYENCLHTYDQLINICGQYPKKAISVIFQ
uniref:Phospholipase A2 n=1 Tax=Heterorhabditis bacteriophora TaxID=37862 RepID=A0A1I7WY08_HETBA